MINVEKAVYKKFPTLKERSYVIRTPTLKLLKKLIKEEEINQFLCLNQGAWGLDFIERIFEFFDFSYMISAADKANIPAIGRVVIFANHPIGSLDGLALLKLIREVRQDVRILANDMLQVFTALDDLIIPLDNIHGKMTKKSYKSVMTALEREEAIIVFPSGEVSRARPQGVRDSLWRSGFLTFARKAQAPLLPVRIEAKNSWLFYTASMVFKPFGTLLLAREMFNKKSITIRFYIGEPILATSLVSSCLSDRTLIKRLKSHLYKLGRKKTPHFETLRTIAHPEPRHMIWQELKANECLGETRDGHQVYICDYAPDSSIMREIGRVRELAFRKVGEGTGRRRDLDVYDQSYRHLVLWDKDAAYQYLHTRFQTAGYSIPILFKQYTALFEEGGFKVLAFGVDPDFNQCVDALCLTDLSKLKSKKRARYFSAKALTRH